ncbi:hypothetical protein L9F63_025742, partial [Diploptera punctata]
YRKGHIQLCVNLKIGLIKKNIFRRYACFMVLKIFSWTCSLFLALCHVHYIRRDLWNVLFTTVIYGVVKRKYAYSSKCF